MHIGGWHRLWILLSVLYFLFVGFITIDELPKFNDTHHEYAFYEQLSSKTKDKISKKIDKPSRNVFDQFDFIPDQNEQHKKPRFSGTHVPVGEDIIWDDEIELKGVKIGTYNKSNNSYVVTMKNLFSFSISRDYSIEDVVSIAREYWVIVKSQHTKNLLKHFGIALAFWFIPVVTVYLLSLAVAWVYNGFKKGNHAAKRGQN